MHSPVRHKCIFILYAWMIGGGGCFKGNPPPPTAGSTKSTTGLSVRTNAFEPVFQTPPPPPISHRLEGPPSPELQWTTGQNPRAHAPGKQACSDAKRRTSDGGSGAETQTESRGSMATSSWLETAESSQTHPAHSLHSWNVRPLGHSVAKRCHWIGQELCHTLINSHQHSFPVQGPKVHAKKPHEQLSPLLRPPSSESLPRSAVNTLFLSGRRLKIILKAALSGGNPCNETTHVRYHRASGPPALDAL